MADALGVAELDGLADVEAQAFGRDEAGSELAGMQADVHLWVDGVEVIEHLHLEGVVAHGDKAVFGLDEVDADEARLVGVHGWPGWFQSQEGFGRRPARGEAAQNLVDVANFDLAGGRGLRGFAVLDLAALGFGGADVFAVGGYFAAEAGSSKSVWRGWAESGFQPSLSAIWCGVAEGRRLHELEVLLILGGGAAGDFVDPLADVALAQSAEAVKGGEELVVAAEAGRGDKAAHGEGVDEAVVEVLVGGAHVAGEPRLPGPAADRRGAWRN